METGRLILGTAGLGGVWGEINPEQSVGTILQALDYGIDAIDTAPAYGDAELLVGEALKQWNGRKPSVSSKVGRLRSYAPDDGRYDYSEKGMKESVETSLRALSVSSLDILFLHDPMAVPSEEAERIVKTMARFREEGYARKIGLGGNSPDWLNRFGHQGVFDFYMEYNRLNACNVTALQDTIPFCDSHGIGYFAASPLHMGLLGKNYQLFSRLRPSWLDPGPVMVARELDTIADKHHMELAELAYRFLWSLKASFHIVLGASDRLELHSCICALEKGALPEDVLKEIMQCSHAM